MVRCCRDDVARDVEFSGYFRPKARSYETAVFQFRFCARDIRSTLIGFASVGDKQFNGDGGDRASLRDARRYYACLERDPRLRAAGGFGHHGPWCLSQSPCVPSVRLIPCHPRIALPGPESLSPPKCPDLSNAHDSAVGPPLPSYPRNPSRLSRPSRRGALRVRGCPHGACAGPAAASFFRVANGKNEPHLKTTVSLAVDESN